ncbi:hypothetical protein NFI96_012712 [Prochilodus magdalenae]|nr:hypothetical protein NFI96_012712 [Prochilodus magdalenae]
MLGSLKVFSLWLESIGRVLGLILEGTWDYSNLPDPTSGSTVI